MARVLGPKFSDGLGRPVVVENRAGAGGSIGEAFLAFARAESDTWAKVIRDYNIRVE